MGGTDDTVPPMGHSKGIMYTLRDDDFSDVTGSEYDAAAEKDPDWIFGVLREVKLRERAAVEAAHTVRVQAARALIRRGMTIREASRYMDMPKSTVARLARGGPWRSTPLPDIDRLVRDVWDEGLAAKRATLAPRAGDRSRGYSILLNLWSSGEES